MAQVDKVSQNKDFCLQSISKASQAAQGLYHWLKAIENYYYIYEESKPKRDAVMLAEKQLLMYQDQISDSNKQLRILQDKLADLRDAYKGKEDYVKDLQEDIDACVLRKTRAAKLLNALTGEKQKWFVLDQITQQKIDNLHGDCLLAAALIIYLGQFTINHRETYLDQWYSQLKDHSLIQVTEHFDFIKIFGDKAQIKEWVMHKLPCDSFSIQNAIMIDMCSEIQIVIIDPEQQANIWLSQTNKEEDSLLVLNVHSPRFVTMLSSAIKYGKKVLAENVGETIHKVLYPFFNKSMMREDAGQKMAQIGPDYIAIDPNFKLFITTQLSNPVFPHEIQVNVNLVNFTITRASLEAQLLSLVVQEAMDVVEAQFVDLKLKTGQNMIRLQDLETLILDKLDQDIMAVLGDEQLIENLTQSSYTSKRITQALHDINKRNFVLEKERSKYMKVARRGSQVYFLLKELPRINRLYQYSLKWYLDIFQEQLSSKALMDAADSSIQFGQKLVEATYERLCLGVFQQDRALL